MAGEALRATHVPVVPARHRVSMNQPVSIAGRRPGTPDGGQRIEYRGDGEYVKKQGLYDPAFEHEACGVGFVVDIKGRKSHRILQQGLQVLVNLGRDAML